MKKISFLILALCMNAVLQAQTPETFLGEKNRMGLREVSGKIILPAKYDYISLFNEGFNYASINKKTGFFNRSGKFITPIKYDAVTSFQNGFARVNIGGVWKDDDDDIEGGHIDGGKWAVINKLGQEVTPFKYDDISIMAPEGFALVRAGNQWGVINAMGKEIFPLKYDHIELSDNELSLAMVCIGGKPDILADQESFNVWDGGKQGFINCVTGKAITTVAYDRVADFFEGLAAVSLNGKWGFVDKNGKVVIPIKYDIVGDFNHGKTDVKLNGKKMFIDKSGKEIK